MTEPTKPAVLPQWIAAHIELYLQDPEKAHYWDSTIGGGPGPLPTLLLISKGRKSGENRMLPLIYKKIGDNFVIVASKGGAPNHPSWYLNLVAEPRCEIHVGADVYQARAKPVVGERRQSLWQEMARLYPPYDDYQAATNRTIPIVELIPQI